MAQTWKKTIQIRFREADPARIMYFANIFSLAHDTFEDFIQANGFTWDDWFTGKSPTIAPIRHAKCDYLSPFRLGENYQVHVCVAQIRQTSLQMRYVFMQGARVHAVVKMVHSFLEPQTRQKTAVSDFIRARFQTFLENQA